MSGPPPDADSQCMTNDVVSSKRPFRVWLGVATLILVAGTSTSLLAARADARNDASARLRDFETASAKVASTLKLALQREEDLVVSQAAFVTGNPGASMADYLKWTESVQAFQRYPELEGIGSLTYVPASRLPAFTELATANSCTPRARTASSRSTRPATGRTTASARSGAVVRSPRRHR